jgi:hypothetical protein
MRGFTVLNYQAFEREIEIQDTMTNIFHDDPNRFGAYMWLYGDTQNHVVVSKHTSTTAAHTWNRDIQIATWNNPVIVPWWDKKARWGISVNADQTLRVVEIVAVEGVPRQ